MIEFATEPGILTTEQKFKQKCGELKKRISEIEETNEIAVLALSRTRTSIRRLRLEYSILLERLEDRVYNFLSSEATDLILRPGSPALLDETLNLRSAKLGNSKGSSEKADKSGRAASRRAVKDPNMPKRPASAYFFFCEQEREKLREEFEAQNPGKPATEFTKQLVESWKSLAPDLKAPFMKSHEEDKQRYAKEMLVYNERKTSEKATVASEGVDGSEAHAISEPAEHDHAEGTQENGNVEGTQENGHGEGNQENDGDVKMDGESYISTTDVGVGDSKPLTANEEPIASSSSSQLASTVEPGEPVKVENTEALLELSKSAKEDSEQRPMKKIKLEATKGPNGQPKITIKIRSPTAPQS